ncbi:MAG TPA: Do family serine endopeptidase [Xanthobacteraceae bacterium]|nr:Do family serine endopeptidase [Xanthobacteraceae bacterium]
MNQTTPPQFRIPRVLTGRRIVLLASVAAIGGALLLAGPGGYWGSTLGTPPAQAADSSAAVQQPLPHPQGFADLVAKVKPAVISVRVKIPASADPAMAERLGGDDQQQIPALPGSPLYKFFQQFGDQFGGQSGTPQGHETIIGEGSGFFISPDGYAVTNNHVVNHAKSVQVTTDDGKIYTAKVVGTDPKTDLALIKVEGKNDFPYVQFANNRPKVGDWVVAVGNPFGLGGTVTAGIISARGRDIGAGPYDDYIQIDAPINKGNSGGPAFDVDGNVIGVNTAIYSPSGGSVGIGFDIPAGTAKMVVAELKKDGHVTRGWLGVQIQPVTPGIADSLGLKKAEGAMVDEPQGDSPAAKAGIKSGDVITAVNGTPVKDARDLARTIGMMTPDSAVKLDILRQGEQKTVSVTLARMPNNEQVASNDTGQNAEPRGVPHLGLQVAPAKDVSGAGNEGVVVTGVDPDGPAAEQGFRTGTVILDVGGKAVANAGDVRQALIAAKAQGKHDVLMRVKAGDVTRFVAMPLGKA